MDAKYQYLHDHKNFPDLLRLIEEQTGVSVFLVEKDYWLMHVLYGLKQQGYNFNLKGGTSLSKGYNIIHRFSEDIDIYIKPDPALEINEKSEKEIHIKKREKYYDDLVQEISIPGIIIVERDKEFDDQGGKFRSGGIRLKYESYTTLMDGVKEGLLLEAGFDTVTPFDLITISSWAYDKAVEAKVPIIDNRAIDIPCYHPGYTLIEKIQTIIRKYRVEKESGVSNPNFMRQYYDVSCLLDNDTVKEFIGTEDYLVHKAKRIRGKDAETPVAENDAFLLSNTKQREEFAKRYQETAALYYKGQPSFDEVLGKIKLYLDKL